MIIVNDKHKFYIIIIIQIVIYNSLALAITGSRVHINEVMWAYICVKNSPELANSNK